MKQIQYLKKTSLLIGAIFFASLLFAQTITVGPTPDQYRLNADKTVDKYEGTKWNKIGDGFASIKADLIYPIGTKTDGSTLIYIENKWNSIYQTVKCHGKTYTVSADKALIYQDNPAGTVGGAWSVDVLRSENDNLICHSKDGKVWKYNFKAPEWWTQIKQIITVDGQSYYIRNDDNSIWRADPVNNNDVKIGLGCKLLISNDNTLVSNSISKTYWRYGGAPNSWAKFTPTFVGASPEAYAPGFWSFIQNKSALDNNSGLTVDAQNKLVMSPIPATGNCDKFLWRTELLTDGTGHYKLVNKGLGNTKALDCSLTAPSIGDFGVFSGQAWIIKQSNASIHGTNAINLSNEYITEQKSLDIVSGKVAVAATNAASINQVWIFQFAQMVSGTMLPLPSDTTVAATFNKKLSGKNGVSFYASNTASDWALVNTYLILNNFMNAVKDQGKLATAIAGQNLVVISKDDPNTKAFQYPMLIQNGFSQNYITAYRGGSGYKGAAKAILVTEEMMCKTGVVNRPAGGETREFEQVVHEFAHAVQDLCGWIPSIDANNICPNEKGVSSECFCWKCQAWFNSCQSQGANQSTRANMSATDKTFMGTKFNVANTWMPPKKLRN